MSQMRRPWFELDDDRLVVVNLIVGLEPNLNEIFMDDKSREERSRTTLCKLVLMTRQISSHGVVLYEKSFEDMLTTYTLNVIGIVAGPEQTQTETIRVNINWVGRIHCNTVCYIPDVVLLLVSIVPIVYGFMRPWLQLVSGALMVVAGGIKFIESMINIMKTRKVRSRYSKMYPCQRTSWSLVVKQSRCDIAPILWNETMFTPCRTPYAKMRLSRAWIVGRYIKTKPRVLCSSIPYIANNPCVTPSGVILSRFDEDDEDLFSIFDEDYPFQLPDIRDINIAMWRKEKMHQFRHGELRKELMAASWHPRRVALGLIDID